MFVDSFSYFLQGRPEPFGDDLSSFSVFPHAGMEELEAEAWWELPEDHVLPGSPLPDLHAAEDAEHGPGHGGKPERPAAGPVQVSQRDARPPRLPDLQIRHVLPTELKKKNTGLCFPLSPSLRFLFIWDTVRPEHVINSALSSHRGKF